MGQESEAQVPSHHAGLAFQPSGSGGTMFTALRLRKGMYEYLSPPNA